MSEKIGQERAGMIMQAVLRGLRDLGGEARPKDIFAAVRHNFSFTDYENALLPSGSVRWETLARFYSIDSEKAGFIVRNSGKWQLTNLGEKSLDLTPMAFFKTANGAYKAWRAARDQILPVNVETAEPDLEKQPRIEAASEEANEEIEKYLGKLDPFTFQNLVAELLTAMGYFIPYVSPPGPDYGIDVIAYSDPLGIKQPHVVVQVKHQLDRVGMPEIKQLHGSMKDGNIGLFVSLNGFRRGVSGETRNLQRHIELIDGDRLLQLWIQHYEKLSERGKQILPLEPIYFLKPTE